MRGHDERRKTGRRGCQGVGVAASSARVQKRYYLLGAFSAFAVAIALALSLYSLLLCLCPGAGKRGRGDGVGVQLQLAEELGANVAVERLGNVGLLLQQQLELVPSLRRLPAVSVPGAALRNETLVDAEVEEFAGPGDALAKLDVEDGLLEGRRNLVLGDRHAHLVPGRLLALLVRRDLPDVQPHARVELQRITAGRHLWAAEHHADLVADLVDEDEHGLALGERGGDDAHGLRHHARLGAHVVVADLALQFALGHERCDAVHDDDVHCVRLHQSVADLQRLLAEARLAHEKVVRVHAQPLAVGRVEGVLGVDEGAGAAQPLCLGHDVEGERGLAAALGAVDLRNAAAGEATHAQRAVQHQRARGDHTLHSLVDLAAA
mmetsp:Transcript_11888/g.47917  ORF Transcript_11888/g.47917 Transcript_11888/m.47917 type:complete len:378 (+) Transcript_11888:1299-2432(+)